MRTLIKAVSKRARQRLFKIRAIGIGEFTALGIAVTALAIGPAAVLAYGRYMDRNVVVVHAQQWQYAPNVLHAKAGVPIRIRLESDDVVHGFRVIGLDAQVTRLVPGKSMELTVTAPKPGTYLYMCTTFCGLKHATMFGRLIVTAP